MASQERQGGVRYLGIPLKRTDPGQRTEKHRNFKDKIKDAQTEANPCVNRSLNFSLLKPPPLLALSFSSPSAGR
jgi:hypothetical protein